MTPLHLKDASLPSSGTQACTPASLGVERGPDSRMQRTMLWLGPRAPMLESQMPQRLTQSKRPAQHLWASVSSRATRLMHLKGFGKGLKYSTNIKNPSWRPEENPIKGRVLSTEELAAPHTAQAVGGACGKGRKGRRSHVLSDHWHLRPLPAKVKA